MNEKEVKSLLTWYENNKRDLPWRHTLDPYAVWVSEIMLQQTRVEAVKPYYFAFLEKYPDVKSLSLANEDDLNRLWEGLGYYSRVRNMHKAAGEVEDSMGGLFPASYDLLIKLPGIGDYTAGAVSSIAGGECVPAVDGNVLRVYTRLTACEDFITDEPVKKRIRAELLEIMQNASRRLKKDFHPGLFNAAFMELGATVCLPNGEPKCENCPLSKSCIAHKEGRERVFPKKAAKSARRIEKRTLFILDSPEGIALHKRPDRGLLAGLYEFPAAEGFLSRSEALNYLKDLGYHPLKLKRIEDSKHVFSHVEWHMHAYHARVDALSDPVKTDDANEMIFITARERKEGFALPSAFGAYKKYIL